MNPHLLAALAVVAAYLIGAIPFGYTIFYWTQGIDIRTVGSGNIGATNVGRQLGFRFFVLVFLLDMTKGFLPTWGFPLAVHAATGLDVPSHGVLVALAAILGHNFPIYLKFQGGKGVATSFGALVALDALASLSAVVGFFLVLAVTRYVSLSSILGGISFVAVYFVRTPHPWNWDHIGMSVFTLALLALLIVRHRKNLERIAKGTEPKVSLGKKPAPPAGRVSWALILVLVGIVLGLGFGFTLNAARRSEVALGPFTLLEVARVGTGHQRAERLAFVKGGRLLAVLCPRYNRVVLYRVARAETLAVARDIELEGRPVAVCAARDRFYVLQRPPGDSRHIVPGWWETFDFQGERIGSRCVVGFYPDDMVLSADGRHALVLTSGRAEGGPNRPAPALEIVALGPDSSSPRVVGRLTFDGDKEDPARITLSVTGRCAAVTLLGSNEVAAVDLFDREHPRLVGRAPLRDCEVPYPSQGEGDSILMPVVARSEALWIAGPDSTDRRETEYVACTLPHGSGLRLYHGGTGRALGELTLRGVMNLGKTKPTGLAYTPERGLIAVANRSGGVHLIALHPRAEVARTRDEVAIGAGLTAVNAETEERKTGK